MTNNLFSQDVYSEYKFFKEKLPNKNFRFHCTELDSLILFKDKSYSRIYSYQCHQLDYSEQKGNWKIENGILYLNATGNKSDRNDIDWTILNFEYKFKVRRSKLVFLTRDKPFSMDDDGNFNVSRKLKKVKKRFANKGYN